jgi:hypothetical protein
MGNLSTSRGPHGLSGMSLLRKVGLWLLLLLLLLLLFLLLLLLLLLLKEGKVIAYKCHDGIRGVKL